MKEYTFKAIIKTSEIGSSGAYIKFPFDATDEFGGKNRIKVSCTLDNIEYQGSLVKLGSKSHIIGISKDIRKKTGKDVGDEITVVLHEDTNEKAIVLHPLLVKIFQENVSLRQTYDKLPYTKKKEISQLLTNAKKEETIKSRLEKILDELKNIHDKICTQC